MSGLFHVLEDTFVILRSRRGVFRQAKVYSRGDRIYAGIGSGFVQLVRGGTSCPDLSWSDLTPHPLIDVPRVGAPSITYTGASE